MTDIQDFTTQYGLVQKIDAFGYLDYLKNNPDAPRKHGKIVLVTADTPLKASRGEGKTTTTIALIDALNKRGIDAAAVLRQPSMGITAAGSKGGASGGGKASLTHPELAWRYPFHVRRLENFDIPTFPLINLWEGEDDQIDSLRATAKDLDFREPIIGNLFRDGGEALAPQLDGFVAALEGASGATQFHSRKGMNVVENVRWIAQNAYGVPAERVILKDGFAESLNAADALCKGVGVSIDDLAVVAVKSPATMTDNDRAPEAERTVTLKKVEVHAGAGLVHVNLTTSLTTPMPKIV